MIALFLNVVNDIRHSGFGNGEYSVAVLPSEILQVFEMSVDPKRRVAFHEFGAIAGRKSCGNADERVSVILEPADLQCDHLVLTSAASDASQDIIFDFGFDQFGSVLG